MQTNQWDKCDHLIVASDVQRVFFWHVCVIICGWKCIMVKLPVPDMYIYPARACASKGLCDRSWCLYIVYKSGLFFGTNLLSPKILTFRGLF